MTRAVIKWKQKPQVHANNFQKILKAYRSEYDFVVEDGNYDPARAGEWWSVRTGKPVPSQDRKRFPPTEKE